MSQRALGQQFQQLDLFRPAGELRDPAQTLHGDLMAGDSPDKMFGHKLRTANTAYGNSGVPSGATLQSSIQQEGIHTPVDLWHGAPHAGGRPILSNGHHRVSVANDLDPKMLVPVRHKDDAQQGFEARERLRRQPVRPMPVVDPYRTSSGWDFT